MTLNGLAARAALLVVLLASGCTSERPRGTQCAFNTECERGLVCADGFCRAPCGEASVCPEGMRCSPIAGTALTVCLAATEETRCEYASDCASPQVCSRDGRCRPQCRTDYDCRVLNPFTTCVEGSCALVCADPAADCDGQQRNGCETDLRSDLEHCGACGNTCRAGAHQSVNCEARRCATRCEQGFADCDNVPANGCEADLSDPAHCGACGNRCEGTARCAATGGEGARRYACVQTCPAEAPTSCGSACVDTRTDTAHCGACGTACAPGANADARCVDGSCAARCTDTARYADCDGMASTGCEAELPTSPAHCGACGNRCEPAANADPACADGSCALACQTAFGNCDGDRANGCEADLRVSVTSCGMCGVACSAPPHARPTCADGRCGFACETGYADCDADAANGCEVDTRVDGANCGACGTRCGAGLVCSTGTCRSNCATGETNCSGACANLDTSTAHCGACGRACASPPNATATCASRACAFTCASGFGDCDGNPSNGCETSLATSPASCGACGRACAPANATGACASARCVVASCAAGFGDCDSNPANGCETATSASAAHCGACGRACNPANATGACVAGACRIASCAAGFGDCDGNPANGCETSLTTSVSHCGACGAVCSSQNGSPTCAAGRCAIVCAAGFGDCDMSPTNGCETSLNTTTSSCGACGRVCSLPNAVASCAGGVCGVARCNAGYGNCDNNPANGCETDLNATPASCGACGRVCSLPNAVASCAGGVCGVARCNAGYGDCDSSPSNGCETDLNATPASCGACGRACALPNAVAACSAGQCAVARCNAGYGNCDNNAANGCEANLNTASAHCGACNAACGGRMVCSNGRCTTVCASPTTNCSNACVTLATDTANCGACGNRCPTPANASAVCASGACGGVCAAGFGDCNATMTDGCETSTLSAVAHCGACGRACAPANATGACASGSCGVARCNAGFGDCDMSPGNGCETNLTSTPTSCGACGRACSLPNATAGCAMGACTVASCNAGYGDCDNNPANGCETDLGSTVSHCGACGSACSGANGSPLCRAGACSITCGTGFANCDNDARRNGCETPINTVSNCNACGSACSYANATASCIPSMLAPGWTCAMGNCAAGFANCNQNPADGCEVNIGSSYSDCGGCGTTCAIPERVARYPHTCQTGVCRPTNDLCGDAEVINLASGPSITLASSTRYARREGTPPCQANVGSDVWYRFTLTQRELVYADTFGATWDTVLYFASGCTTPLTGSTTPGDAVCNDDATATCANEGTRSQVVAVLNPGTYYLVLAGFSTNVGEANITFQHIPVGSGPMNLFTPAGASFPRSITGSTSGAGGVAGTCGGNGPEVSYWWRSCPSDQGGRFYAHTCTQETNFDTVLYLRGGAPAGDLCNDDDAGFCASATTRSRVLTSVPAGKGLHVFTVDSYSTPGNYNLMIAYPYSPIT